MQRQITSKQRWLRVETSQGTDFLNVFDLGCDWPNSDTLTEEIRAENLETLQEYCEGEPESWENILGYGCRLSAPGYLDCTEWAVFETVEECNDYLSENYPEDEEETEG